MPDPITLTLWQILILGGVLLAAGTALGMMLSAMMAMAGFDDAPENSDTILGPAPTHEEITLRRTLLGRGPVIPQPTPERRGRT